MTNNIRPLTLENFIGQKEIVDNLQVFIKSAKSRNAPLDHVLFSGPPGLGKTTLAQIVANELGVNYETIAAPAIKSGGDLMYLLMALKENSVLFIDEIHRLHPAIEETLYSAMEDFKITITVGEDENVRAIPIDLPKFTLIGATTRLGMISNPLRDRFGIPINMRLYTVTELKNIILRAAEELHFKINKNAASLLAKCSRGTPRIAINLLKRVNDFAIAFDQEFISEYLVTESLKVMEIDKIGLNKQDYKYLRCLKDNTVPIGIETIAGVLTEDADSIKETIEPYLLQIGFIQKTPKGRIITIKAVAHIENA